MIETPNPLFLNIYIVHISNPKSKVELGSEMNINESRHLVSDELLDTCVLISEQVPLCQSVFEIVFKE